MVQNLKNFRGQQMEKWIIPIVFQAIFGTAMWLSGYIARIIDEKIRRNADEQSGIDRQTNK